LKAEWKANRSSVDGRNSVNKGSAEGIITKLGIGLANSLSSS